MLDYKKLFFALFARGEKDIYHSYKPKMLFIG
jgi:hypothetical protein